MELGRLIKVNFQGDCFYRRKEIKDPFLHCVALAQNLNKKDEADFGNVLKVEASFPNAYAYNIECNVSDKELVLVEILIHYFGYCMQASNMRLPFTRTKIKKMTKEEYNSFVAKAESDLSIRFCKIKVANAPDFDYVFAFVKDEGDFPKAITEYFKKLQEKHPRKYKNLKYRIQFTGKI